MVNLTPWESAQQAVLGSVLIDEKRAAKMLGETSADQFDQLHRPVWLAISECFQEGKPIDPVVISNKLGGDDNSRMLVRKLMEETPTAAFLDAYLEVLKEQSQLRVCRELGNELAMSPTMDSCWEVMEKISTELVTRPGILISSLGDMAVSFLDRMDSDEKKDYLDWPFPELERTLYIEPGSYVIIGGYPSEGKTAFALQCAVQQARKRKIGFFSYETSGVKLYDRVLAHLSKVPLSKIKETSSMDDGEKCQIMQVLRKSDKLSMDIVEAGGLTVRDIHNISVARQFDLIYIDYIQLIQPSNPKDLRHEQVAKISRDLHIMAQTTGISVIGLSQLSRPDKGLRPKRKEHEDILVPVPEPAMSDLRESGQLEQDADAIMLLWRPYPDSKDTDRRMKLAKNKEGITGKKLVLAFDGITQTFAVKNPRSISQRFQELPGADPDFPFQ